MGTNNKLVEEAPYNPGYEDVSFEFKKQKEMIDYSELLIKARENLKGFETAMNNRRYAEAHEWVMNAFVDVRLLTHLTPDRI
jgi:hypothetical protein